MCIYLACCSRRLKCRCSWMFWFPCQCLKCSEEMLMETTGHWGEKRKNLFDIHSDQWQWWFNIFGVSTCHFCREVYPQSRVFSCGQVWMLTWTCFFMLLSEMLSPHPAFPVDWSGLITHESTCNHRNSALEDQEIWMMFFYRKTYVGNLMIVLRNYI